MPFIATAAWSIPRTVARRFPEAGTGLERYAAVFDGVEVNSTFYRHHQVKTFERWAASVPEHFRFAVKIPREITHTERLRGIDGLFDAFLNEIRSLKDKLGPLLCQLPPSLEFDATMADEAFAAMRYNHAGMIVVEPRHNSWASEPAESLLQRHAIERVLADPAPVWPETSFDKPPKYVRLHGSPKIYYSSYSKAGIERFGKRLADDSWCIFDNTASGAAIENALTMRDQLI
ncbi:DUF72 domain-containing protein [Shinella sedimenti]|uniref:DUF72 domain-containing protein n=1 Tax=Shinella sedimenti TaxID=2919913 RepID=A0ABT0CNJ8_9HYPH|nr:DUF72 domain-containing protein [Shinella sedimenti]MCJ8150184.1 DUF72 domain-containing protein [Shinella sedimenti]